MKVDANRSVGTTGVRKDSKSGAASGFADNLRVDTATAPAAVSGAAMVSGLDGLFALQEVSDSTAQDRKALVRGDEILDRLEDLRRGLLLGRIGQDKLAQLARLASESAAQANDPKLRELLQEIDLRAQVEMAKLQQNQA
jgi:hypothetical protein